MLKSGQYFNKRYISKTVKIVAKDILPAAAYTPDIVEKKVYDEWERRGLFKADSKNDKRRFSIVLPPPNVTGKLHLGHALSNTIQDVIVRRKRSQGYNVLWLPGTDHAGIATQGVVEKYLKTNQNINRHDIGRDKFIQEVWKWKEEHGNIICQQLRTMGCSLDWSKEIFTMNENHTNAVNTAFIRLFKKGLTYRKKALVNWCNALKSTLSDIEVENISIDGPTDISIPSYDVPVKFGLIYNISYKLIDSNEEVIVSTTTPETILGDTAIAVNPRDERYSHLKGRRAVHPFRKTTIPIILDNFVDMKLGTGAVKITPAHSKVDYEVAKHHNLEMIQVIDENGRIQNGGEFDGMKKYEGREEIVTALQVLGLLKSIDTHQMTLPICSRSGDVIEYLPKEQWFLSCSKLNKRAIEVVRDKKITMDPERYVKNWLNWAEDDKDWCISRQLWWGHQIPAYKCSLGEDLIWIAAVDSETAKIEASKYLRVLPDDITVSRDQDVLDTWFSSGIYPFAALGWPENNIDLHKFYPLDLMVTGHDILGFWVHRMVILGLELTGQLPFDNVLLHGVICDSKGAKMSKSKGNIIDPIDVINGISMEGLKEKVENMQKDGLLTKDEVKRSISYHRTNFSNTNGIPECGVDALRFTLLTQDIKSNFVSFDVNQCHANKLFCNKIWQSVKYVRLSMEKLKFMDDEITKDDLNSFDRWILSKLSDMVAGVNKSIDDNNFHIATKCLKTLIYSQFCDVYLESTKPGFDGGDEKTGYAHAHTLSAVLNTSLRCLSPFMIYITHELIPKIPNFETNVIYNFDDDDDNFFKFPKYEDFQVWKNVHVENRIDRVIDAVILTRELKGFYNITNKLKPTVYINTTDESLLHDIKNNIDIVRHLSKTSDVRINEEIKNNVVSSNMDGNTEVGVGIVGDKSEDIISAAKEKLQKRIKKLEDSLSKLEMKLSSSHYVKTVPEHKLTIDKQKVTLQRDELKRLQRL
ncbi:valyl-tRNA synthetase [Danaus plexippus plexippus]|uniref:Valine--tRNA ligase n=1 Tax=Danaus plexippus plexippus TaxID=278856 RepID=A0A212F762_DANPL|nr:valyl-tRNA synthetase [Danaus plexippus plexippus]